MPGDVPVNPGNGAAALRDDHVKADLGGKAVLDDRRADAATGERLCHEGAVGPPEQPPVAAVQEDQDRTAGPCRKIVDELVFRRPVGQVADHVALGKAFGAEFAVKRDLGVKVRHRGTGIVLALQLSLIEVPPAVPHAHTPR